MSQGEKYFGQNSIRASIRDAQNSLRRAENSATKSYQPEISPLIKERSPQLADNQTKQGTAKSPQPLQDSFKYTGTGRPLSKISRSARTATAVANQISSKSPKAKRSKTPLAFILTLLLSCGALMFGATSLLGVHLDELYTSATDVQYTSYSLRNARLMKYMLDGGDQIKTTWQGARKYTNFTPYMKERLAKEGIEVGTLNSDGSFSSDDSLANKSRVLRYNGETITADNFTKTFNQNSEFREAYYKAKRGRLAGFFDDAAAKFYSDKGQIRNVFKDYKQTGDAETDESNFQKTLSDHFSGKTNSSLNTASDKTTTDEDGNETTERTADGTAASSSSAEGSTARQKAQNYINSISSKVNASSGIACATMKVGSLIAVTVAANQVYQSINYFMTFEENISKMKSGNGTESAINQVLNFFTTSTTSEITDVSTNEQVEVTGSPLESQGAKLVLGQESVDSSKTQNYTIESVNKSVSTALGVAGLTTAGSYAACAIAPVVSLAVSAAPGGTFVRLLGGMLLDTAAGVATQVALAAALSALIPKVASVLFENVFETTTGIPAGELYSSGASASNGMLARSASGLAVSDKSAALAYNQATNQVLAADAEIDRNTHSPFDITNQNTFLGSIASNLTSVISTSGTLSGLASLTKTSLNSLLGSASAEGEGSSYQTTFGDCPTLDAIGVAGDIYCNPITTADLSTIDIAPDDATYQSVLEPNLEYDEEGNESIKDNSNLANYIVYCTERESPFGITDASIASAFETSLGIVGDNLPIVGDVVQLVNVAEDAAASGWATGANCVNSSSNPYWDSEFKYYQRYIEDNRILDQMGAFEDSENPVTAYKTHYESENSKDNSAAGTLARISGLSTEDAELALEIVDYLAWLQDYDASDFYLFGSNNQKSLENSKSPQISASTPVKNVVNITTTAKEDIIYFDLRSKNHVA